MSKNSETTGQEKATGKPGKWLAKQKQTKPLHIYKYITLIT